MGLLLGLRLTGLVCLDQDDETVVIDAQGSLLEGPLYFLCCHPWSQVVVHYCKREESGGK